MTAVAAPAQPSASRLGASVGRPAGSPTGWLALGAAGMGATVVAGRALGHQLPPCLLRDHTGVPCPVCGFTRLGLHLIHGELAVAVRGDLPGLLAVVLVVVLSVGQLVAMRTDGQTWLRARWVPALLALAIAGHWVLTLATGGLST